MSSENLTQKIHYQFEILKRYDDYISSSNVKAGLLLSFLGAMVFGLFMRFMAIFNADPSLFLLLTIGFIGLTVLSTVVAAWFLLATVFPNTSKSSRSRSLIFFGDVAQEGLTADQYFDDVLAVSQEGYLNDITEQVFLVAHIVKLKFENLKKAITAIKFLVIPLLLMSIALPFVGGIAESIFQ